MDNSRTYWPIEKLHEWEDNPRSISTASFTRLKAQIIKHGQYKPLLVMADGTVIGGNMRLRAYKELGIINIWVSVIEFVEIKTKWFAIVNGERQKHEYPSKKVGMMEYSLSDNDSAGYNDAELMANVIGNLPEVDWENYGAHMKEPTNLKELVDRYQNTHQDDAPALATGEPVSKRGEIYKLGGHALMCGDATSWDDVQRLCPIPADMVFTDPPYNVDYQGSMNTHDQNKRDPIMNDNMSAEQFYTFLRDSIGNMMNVCTGPFYICMASKELPNLKRAFEESGGHWQSYIIWVKNTFTLSRSDYQNQYEPILYGWNGNTLNHYFVNDRTIGNVWENLEPLAHYNGKVTEIMLGSMTLEFDGKVTGRIKHASHKLDIWKHDKPSRSDLHPTMKPVALVAEAIKNSSKPNDVVLDLFGGSGSTLIAADQTGRTCAMMELDPRYCDVIRKRYALSKNEAEHWEQATPKL